MCLSKGAYGYQGYRNKMGEKAFHRYDDFLMDSSYAGWGCDCVGLDGDEAHGTECKGLRICLCLRVSTL